MPGSGHAYSTSACVTAPPIAADFAFHFSAAIRRYDELHGARCEAGFDAVISGLLLARAFASGATYPRRGTGFRNPGLLRFGDEFLRLNSFGRLPQPFQIVKLSGFLGEDMDDK